MSNEMRREEKRTKIKDMNCFGCSVLILHTIFSSFYFCWWKSPCSFIHFWQFEIFRKSHDDRTKQNVDTRKKSSSSRKKIHFYRFICSQCAIQSTAQCDQMNYGEKKNGNHSGVYEKRNMRHKSCDRNTHSKCVSLTGDAFDWDENRFIVSALDSISGIYKRIKSSTVRCRKESLL